MREAEIRISPPNLTKETETKTPLQPVNADLQFMRNLTTLLVDGLIPVEDAPKYIGNHTLVVSRRPLIIYKFTHPSVNRWIAGLNGKLYMRSTAQALEDKLNTRPGSDFKYIEEIPSLEKFPRPLSEIRKSGRKH